MSDAPNLPEALFTNFIVIPIRKHHLTCPPDAVVGGQERLRGIFPSMMAGG